HGRLAAVQPRTAVLVARRGEGRAGHQLGVEGERGPLRAVAALRQGAGQRLGGELVAEAALVAKVCHAMPLIGSANATSSPWAACRSDLVLHQAMARGGSLEPPLRKASHEHPKRIGEPR